MSFLLMCSGVAWPRASDRIELKVSNVVVSYVEGISQAVADEVKARHRDRDRGTGNDGEPWGAGEILLSAVEHIAPAGQRRLDSVAEEADIGFEKNGAGDRQACGDDDRPHGIGQDLAEHDMPPA